MFIYDIHYMVQEGSTNDRLLQGILRAIYG